MHRADFEKSVQEKMQELRFQPSDEVWSRVEKGIDEKTHRRFLFFWIPAAVLMLAVAGYFFYGNTTSQDKYSNDKSNRTTNQPGQTIASKKSVQMKEDVATVETMTTPSHSSEKSISDVRVGDVSKSATSEGSNSDNRTSNSLYSKKTNSKSSVQDFENKSTQLTNRTTTERGQSIVDVSTTPTNIIRDLRYSSPIAADELLLIKSIYSSPQDLNISQKSPSVAIAKKDNWEYDVVFSAGVSNVSNGLLKRDSGTAVYSYFNSTTNTYVISGPSEVKPGVGFSIGGNLYRWLGAKWKVGFGLQYQYFSNSIKTGPKIDSAIVGPQSSLSSSASAYYKSSGNIPYHNHYHFISIPVSVTWQFAPQFCWENQASYSRLISTNALHFDATNGTYYEDGKLFDKNQFIFATALNYGWDKNKFQVGPQLQYGLSNLLKADARNEQHLTFIGVKANMRLSKN